MRTLAGEMFEMRGSSGGDRQETVPLWDERPHGRSYPRLAPRIASVIATVSTLTVTTLASNAMQLSL
jgi:hypothetical protein